MAQIIYDSRWVGTHGIGRFAQEVRRRLPNNTVDLTGLNPVTLQGFLGLEQELWKVSPFPRRQLFFSPGYAPPVSWYGSFVFTIHDLIHIDVVEEASKFKAFYYENIVKPAMFRAKKVLTVSEYSRQRLLEWSGVDSSQIVVVGNGVSSDFTPHGQKYQPGYPYILYIRNTKPHKNVIGLLKAFALLPDCEVRLVLSGLADEDTRHEAMRLGIYDRVVFAGRIPEDDLPAYYRGAAVVTMPSLYEGFGLPALEGMACGVPVVVSNTTSLPEVVGTAGILIDPTSPEDLAFGLSRALTNSELRQQMIQRGLKQAGQFRWDHVAAKIHRVLELENP